MKKFVLFSFIMFIAAGSAYAQKSYDLIYKKDNRWVAVEDAKDLRKLLRDAKKEKKHNFYVQLPAEARHISVERLIVLRDILEKQLRRAVTIEEVNGTAKSNHISVTMTK